MNESPPATPKERPASLPRVSMEVVGTALFAATSACLCHLIGRSGRHHPADLPILISTAIVNCSLAVILLEVVGRAMLSPSFIGRP